MAKLTNIQILEKRQQAHDLKAQGLLNREIQLKLDIGRAALADWLLRPRPTDEELNQLRRAVLSPKVDYTGQVAFKSRFDPGLFAQLRQEATIQNTSTNRMLGCAVMLYLECMKRTRDGSVEPVNILGFRA